VSARRAATESTPLRRRFFVLLTLRWFQTGLQVPVLVLVLQARGLSLGSVGVVAAVFGLATAIFELPTGGLADVLGRRQVLIASAVLFVLESVALGLGQDFAVFVAAAAVGGVGRALDSGPLEAWFVDSVHYVVPDASLGRDLARAKTVEAAAAGLGALAGGALVALAPLPAGGELVIDLSIPFLVSGGICMWMLVATVGWIHEPKRVARPSLGAVVIDVPQTIRRGLRLAAGRGPLRRITILMASMGVALSTVELLAPASFAHILGGEDEAAGPYAVLVTLGFFGSATGSLQAPSAARLLHSSSRAITAARLFGACAVLSLATSSFALSAVAIVAFYALNGIARPLISDILHRSVSSKQRATVLSVQSLTFQLAGVLAALTIAPLAQTSPGIAFGIGAGVLAVGSAACISMPSPNNPTRPARVLRSDLHTTLCPPSTRDRTAASETCNHYGA